MAPWPKPCHGRHWATACWNLTDDKTLPFPGKPVKRYRAGDWYAKCERGHVVRGHTKEAT